MIKIMKNRELDQTMSSRQWKSFCEYVLGYDFSEEGRSIDDSIYTYNKRFLGTDYWAVRVTHSWTKEPWKFIPTAGIMRDDEGHCVETVHNHGVKSWAKYIARADHGHSFEEPSENSANMQRIVSCVNALAGIEDPQVFVENYANMLATLDMVKSVLTSIDSRLAKGALPIVIEALSKSESAVKG